MKPHEWCEVCTRWLRHDNNNHEGGLVELLPEKINVVRLKECKLEVIWDVSLITNSS